MSEAIFRALRRAVPHIACAHAGYRCRRNSALLRFVNVADGNSPELLLHQTWPGIRDSNASSSGQTTAATAFALYMEMIMRSTALVIAFVISLTGPASAQKAEIEAINTKFTELFNKGDFSGIASLYTTEATALPPA